MNFAAHSILHVRVWMSVSVCVCVCVCVYLKLHGLPFSVIFIFDPCDFTEWPLDFTEWPLDFTEWSLDFSTEGQNGPQCSVLQGTQIVQITLKVQELRFQTHCMVWIHIYSRGSPCVTLGRVAPTVITAGHDWLLVFNTVLTRSRRSYQGDPDRTC